MSLPKPTTVLIILILLIAFPGIPTNSQDMGSGIVITPENAGQIEEIGVLGLGEVYAVSYAPDGEQAVVASAVGLSVYDIRDWSRPVQIIDNGGELVEAYFTPDEQSLITFPKNRRYWLRPGEGDLKRYDLSSGQSEILVQGFTDSVGRVVASPDSRWLATVEQECEYWYAGVSCPGDDASEVRIRLWDLSSGALVQTVEPDTFVHDIEFHPAKPQLIYLSRPAGSHDLDSLMFWDIEAATIVGTWDFERHSYGQFTISGDGKTIGLPLYQEGYHYMQVDLLDTDTGTIRDSIEITYEAIAAEGFHRAPNHTYRFTGRLWLNDDATQIFTQEYTDPGVAFYVWDTETGSDLFPDEDIAVPPNDFAIPVYEVAFSPQDDTALLVQFNDSILGWNSETQELAVLVGGQRFMEHMVLSRDNRLLAIQGQRYGHSLYDLTTGARIPLPPNSKPLAISDDSRLVALEYDKDIQVWDWQRDTIVQTISDNGSPFGGAAFHRDGILLALTVQPNWDDDAEDDIVGIISTRVYDVTNGTLVASEYQGGGQPSPHIMFSADGRWLMTGTSVWNVETLLESEIVSYSDPGDATGDGIQGYKMAISSDGRLLAIATDSDWRNYETIIYVYDLEAQEEVFASEAQNGYITALAFNPDGTLLVSASADPDPDVRDNSIRLWDLETGEELMTIERQYYDYMRDVAFTSDGRHIITLRGGCHCEGWGFNSAVRIWGIPED